MTGVCFFVCGCQSYHAKPLAPQEIVARVEYARHFLAEEPQEASSDSTKPKPAFTFTRAAELMNRHSPALQEARAEYESALALANVKTPLPNPSVEAGPKYGFGQDVLLRPIQPFGTLNFTIPTGKRLKRQDELNRIQAELAGVEITLKNRELYLNLHRQYFQWVLAHTRHALRKTIADSTEKSRALTKRLVEAGQASSLDLGLLELEAGRTANDVLAAENDIATAEGDLSEVIGVHAEHFSPMSENALPEIPETVPSLKELQDILIFNNPELGRMRAKYNVAEAQLRLEIAKQYPDFRFGNSVEGDTGDRKIILGLTLGIDVPIFDRNQQAIATATAQREEIRSKYEAAANRALAALDRAWRSATLAAQRLKLLKTVLIPKAQSNIELVRKSLEAGATDTLHYLESERTQRGVNIEALESEAAVREAWVAMEQAVGYPLALFPGEKAESLPKLPASEGAPLPHTVPDNTPKTGESARTDAEATADSDDETTD